MTKIRYLPSRTTTGDSYIGEKVDNIEYIGGGGKGNRNYYMVIKYSKFFMY